MDTTNIFISSYEAGVQGQQQSNPTGWECVYGGIHSEFDVCFSCNLNIPEEHRVSVSTYRSSLSTLENKEERIEEIDTYEESLPQTENVSDLLSDMPFDWIEDKSFSVEGINKEEIPTQQMNMENKDDIYIMTNDDRMRKVGQIEKLSFYKHKQPKIFIDTGKFYMLELVLIERQVKRFVELSKKHLEDQGQTGWDFLGINHLADSISQVGMDANRITENLGNKVDEVRIVADRFNMIISDAVTNLLPHVATATSSVEKISNVGVNVNFNFDMLFKMFDDPLTATVSGAVLYLFIELIERKFQVPNLFYIKVLLGSFVVFKAGSRILKLLVEWFKPPTTIAQANWEDWLMVSVQGILFTVFGATLDTTSVVKTVKSLGEAANNATKLSELFTVIVDWFKKSITLVCNTFGLEVFDWLKPQDFKIRNFMDSVNQLLREYNNNPMAVGLEFSERVTRTLMELNDYMATIQISSRNQPVLVAIRDLQTKMLTLQRNVAEAGLAIGERNEPSFLILSGAPGIGKTYLSDQIAQDIVISMAENEFEIIDAQRNWKNKVYVWPTENKHHDQYKGELIVLYPDLFCLTDVEGQPSEATAIVYLVGGQPVQLPAAELSKKQRLFFISKVMIACTNVCYVHSAMFKSIRNVDAVKRRLNRFGYYMWVDPKYIMRDGAGNPIVDPNTNKIKGYENDLEMYGMLDKNRLPDLPPGQFPEDLWHFRKLDFTTGAFAENRSCKYATYIRLVKQHIRDMERDGERKRANLVASAAEIARVRLAEINGLGQMANLEFDEEDFREIEVELLEHETDFKREKERRERLVRKDAIDILRLEQMVKAAQKDLSKAKKKLVDDRKVREELDKIDNEGFFSSDEMPELEPDIIEAQMDQESKEMFDDLDMSFVDIHKLDGSLGIESANWVLDKANVDRQQWKQVFKSKWISFKYTEDVHERLKQIIKDGVDHMVDTSPGEGRASKIANKLYKAIPELSVRRIPIVSAVVYEFLKEITEKINIEFGEHMKMISTEHIIELSGLEYKDALKSYNSWIISDGIHEPFIRSCVQIQQYLYDFYDNYCVPVGCAIKEGLMSFFYSPAFNSTMEFLFVGAFTCLGLAVPIMLLDNYFTNIKNDTDLLKEKAKIERKKLRTVQQGSWVDAESIKQTIDKYMDNFCGLYVSIHKENGQVSFRHPCNIVFLGGKTAVLVDHARVAIQTIQERLKAKPGQFVELIIVPYVTTTMEKSTERFKLDEITFETNEELSSKDLSIIKFKHCSNRPFIYHLIPPLQCAEWISDKTNLDGIFIERTTDLSLNFNGPEKRVDVRFNYGHDLNYYNTSLNIDDEHIPLNSYKYQTLIMKGKDGVFSTHAGYCTSPGFLTDDRKNYCTNLGWKQAQQPWLFYLHTSLRGTNPNGVPIYKELFEPWIKELEELKIRSRPMVEVVNENMKEFEKIIEEELELLAPSGAQSCSLEIKTEFKQIDINHMAQAVMNVPLFVPNKSEIKKSPLYGIDTRTRFPARMGTVKLKDGSVVDTMAKAREPYGINNALINGPLVDEIVHQAMARVMSDSSVPVKKELLTLDQCLYGDIAYKLNSVNWNSSAGFYFRMLKEKYKTDWKNKRWMLDEEGKVKPKVMKVIQRMFDYCEQKLKDGERLYGINIDNVKDELLKLEKVLKADSRLFCTNDFIHLLLCKRYMGSFAGWIFENRIHNGIAIGVNPLSEEWDGVASHIVNNSPDCLFLDHSKFDKRQLRAIMKCVLYLMDMFYGDKGSEASRIRTLLVEDIIDSWHIVVINGKIYFYNWKQGNTSGNFLTAILNSLVNICYIYICAIFAWLLQKGMDPMLLQALPPNPADKALAYITLGDDVVASVKRDLMEGVNFNSIKAMGKYYLNIEITDELKSGGEIPDFRPISDGSFLGRGFIPTKINGVLRFLARLRKYSIIEKVQWIKGIYDPLIEVDKMETAFLELSLYDREEFDAIVKRYAPACKEAYGIYPKYTDFDVARRHVLTLSEYRYSFYDFIDGTDLNGLPLTKLLEKISQNVAKQRYEAGVKAEVEAERSPGYDVIIENVEEQITVDSPAGNTNAVTSL